MNLSTPPDALLPYMCPTPDGAVCVVSDRDHRDDLERVG